MSTMALQPALSSARRTISEPQVFPCTNRMIWPSCSKGASDCATFSWKFPPVTMITMSAPSVDVFRSVAAISSGATPPFGPSTRMPLASRRSFRRESSMSCRRTLQSHHTCDHLVLQLEDILDRSFEAICPKMGPGRGIDKLPRNSDAIGRFPHTAFEQVAHTQLTSHLLNVYCLALVSEARIARDHK